MKQTFYPFGWKQKSEVCPWDKDERMMSDHKGSNAQWIEREYFRSDWWARDPITLTSLHIEEILHHRHSILTTTKSQIQVFAELSDLISNPIWQVRKQSQRCCGRYLSFVPSRTLTKTATSQTAPFSSRWSLRFSTLPWWYTGLLQIIAMVLSLLQISSFGFGVFCP